MVATAMGSYQNAMELLVGEEVQRQIKSLPTKSASYVNELELVAYALNQLPALYATSEKGLAYQLQRGQAKFGPQIKQAVQRSLIAISRDPIRKYVPLPAQQQSGVLREVLNQLRLVLKNDKLEWDMLPKAVEHALVRARQQNAPWRVAQAAMGQRGASAAGGASYGASSNQPAAQTYAPPPPPPLPHVRATPNSERWAERKSTGEPDAGWDNPLYR